MTAPTRNPFSHPRLWPSCSLLWLLLLTTAGGCSLPPDRPAAGDEPALARAGAEAPLLLDRDGRRQRPEQLAATLAGKRVVYIGERHDRYDHHLGQLALLQALHRHQPRLAIGLEQVQQSFQPALDDYSAGRIGETELLRRIRYFERWGYDYRLYRPILRFARERGLTLIALNIDAELHRRYGRRGEGLSETERAALPVLDRSDSAYRERLREVYSTHHPRAAGEEDKGDHGGHDGGGYDAGFERFYSAQLLWDESMAARAATFLRAHPRHTLAILAGSGHLAYRAGIPDRLRRRLAVDDLLVLPAEEGEPGGSFRGADYLLLTTAAELPPAGRLGVAMRNGEGDGVTVGETATDGAAAAAGVLPGDRLLRLDEHRLEGPADVKLALLDKRPGDRVTLRLRRGDGEFELAVELR